MKLNKLLYLIIFLFTLTTTSLFSEKRRGADPLSLDEKPRNIDAFSHFISFYTWQNKKGIQYQNLISRNVLLGLEFNHTKGFSSLNFPSNIPDDFNKSSNSISYNYWQSGQVRFPFGGRQSRTDSSDFGISLKYFLFNSPLYVNAKIAKNVQSGTFRSQEYFYSDLGVSAFCSSISTSNCNNSGGLVQGNSLNISVSDTTPVSMYAGIGMFLVSKFGVFLQLEGNYLLNQKTYNIVLFGDLRGLSGSVNNPDLIDYYINQKYLEIKIKNTNRYSFQYYIGYGFSL